MLVDYFTKVLKGALFRKFRDVIMGYKSIVTLIDPTESSETKERIVIQEPVICTVVSVTRTQELVVCTIISDEGQPRRTRTYAAVV